MGKDVFLLTKLAGSNSNQRAWSQATIPVSLLSGIDFTTYSVREQVVEKGRF